jgi:hypothetical protein
LIPGVADVVGASGRLGSLTGGLGASVPGGWVVGSRGDAAAGATATVVISTRKRAAASTDLGIETSRRSAPATAQGTVASRG